MVKMGVKKKKSTTEPLKIDLFLSGLTDILQPNFFPMEGRFSGELLSNIECPMSEESFDLGLKTSYDQVYSFVTDRRLRYPNYLYTDPSFPPGDTVLARNETTEGIFWRRPYQMSSDPELLVDSPRRYDVIQGEVGDSYFLAPCSAISMCPELLEKILPVNQALRLDDPSYCGLLRFHFWQFGEWTEVIIDDWLPTRDGKKPLYARSAHPDEFWVSLVEKAYAKLHGSYEATCGGFNANSLMDLTGGMVVHHDLQKDSPQQAKDFFRTILGSVRHKSFVCCDLEEYFNAVTDDQSSEPTGMLVHHAYAVTGATEIKLKNGKWESLVRMRNPWGYGTEWNKDWNDKSSKWDNVRAKVLRKLSRRASDDGEWWMTYNEFRKYFRHITICFLGIDSVGENETGSPRYTITSWKGSWVQKVNAGGSGNNIFKYAINPQIMIKLTGPDSPVSSRETKPPNKCHIRIELLQEYRKIEEGFDFPMLGIGLRVYKVKRRKGDKLNRRQLGCPENVVLQSSVYKQQREIKISGHLNPGYYVIVPSTFYPDQSTSYLLRFFTEKSILVEELS